MLPGCVASAGTTGDLPDELFATERPAVGNAVDRRRREFETGRACARMALERLGLPRTEIPAGEHGQPLWPEGIVGSITHCDGYRACAVAWRSDIVSLGIDAEPHAALSQRVLRGIATGGERRRLAARHTGLHLDRILFSAKEAVFKAWFPLASRRLGFKDADILCDTSTASFRAILTLPGPVVGGLELSELWGRWRVQDGLVVTAVVIEQADRPTPVDHSRHPAAGDSPAEGRQR